MKVKINVVKCGKDEKETRVFFINTSCVHFSNPFVSFYELYLILSYTVDTKIFGFTIKPYLGGPQGGSLKISKRQYQRAIILERSVISIKKRNDHFWEKKNHKAKKRKKINRYL